MMASMASFLPLTYTMMFQAGRELKSVTGFGRHEMRPPAFEPIKALTPDAVLSWLLVRVRARNLRDFATARRKGHPRLFAPHNAEHGLRRRPNPIRSSLMHTAM